MKLITNQHWNKRIVMAHLQDAADIHRRLPPVKVAGYYNLWPETMKDEWRRFYDILHGENLMGSPTAREVSYHEEIMEWLKWLDPRTQQLVWMRANRIPWKIITGECKKSKTALWRKVDAGLSRIDSILTGKSQKL